MFVGHGVLAFVIVAWLVRARDRPVREAVALGLLGAGFATLPDVDMLYAPLGLLGGVGSLTGASAAFWDAAARVHRSVTHSLVVGSVVTVAVAVWQVDGPAIGPRSWGATGPRLAALGIGTGLVLAALAVTGGLGATIMVVFVAGAFCLAVLAERRDLDRGWVVVAAATGLLTHPFGDLLTGEPPAFLFPLDVTLLETRVVLAADPTVNLLLAFLVELAVLWLGLLTVVRLQDWRLRWSIQPRAALGVGYASVLVAVPAPSIDAAAPFVVTVLAVGLLGAPVAIRGGDSRGRRLWRGIATALSAVTVAGLAYLAAYLAFG